MSWLEDVRNKPAHEKIKIIWITCGAVAILLILAWILVGGLDNNTPKELRLFQTLNQGVKDASQNFKNNQNK